MPRVAAAIIRLDKTGSFNCAYLFRRHGGMLNKCNDLATGMPAKAGHRYRIPFIEGQRRRGGIAGRIRDPQAIK